MVGAMTLLITAVFAGIMIRRDIKRDQETTEEGTSKEDLNKVLATELSPLWIGFGVVATTFQSALNIAGAVTGHYFYKNWSTALLPIVAVLYTMSIFATPRRRDTKTMWFLWAHFASFSWGECGVGGVKWRF